MLIITLALLAASVITFCIIAANKTDQLVTKADYFSANSSLSKIQVARTTLAANVSLSGGMAWFVTKGSSFGPQIIIWGPLAIFIGMLVNAWFIKRYAPESIFSNYSSFVTMTRELFGKGFTANCLTAVTAIGSFTILLIEVYVAISLLKILLPNAQSAELFMLVFIFSVITLYAFLGGFPGIVRNDWIQNALMLFSGVVIFIIIQHGMTDGNSHKVEVFEANFKTVPFDLILWLIVVNMFFIPCQLRFWQVAGSAQSRNVFVDGYKRAAYQTAVVWAMLAIIGICLYYYIGRSFETLPEMFEFLESKNDLYTKISFVILMIASFAALVSTSDSAIISLAQCVTDTFFPEKSEKTSVKYSVLLVSGLAGFSYLAVFLILGEGFDKIFSSAFSLFILVAPVIVLSMVYPVMAKVRVFKISSIVGLVVATIFVFLGTYTNLIPSVSGSYVGVAGFTLSLMGTLIGKVLAIRH